MFNKDF
jgi:hypothetical protein